MTCEFNDCGWCYHADGPQTGCPGINKCPLTQRINKEYETGRPVEGDEEHQETDAQAHR